MSPQEVSERNILFIVVECTKIRNLLAFENTTIHNILCYGDDEIQPSTKGPVPVKMKRFCMTEEQVLKTRYVKSLGNAPISASIEHRLVPASPDATLKHEETTTS